MTRAYRYHTRRHPQVGGRLGQLHREKVARERANATQAGIPGPVVQGLEGVDKEADPSTVQVEQAAAPQRPDDGTSPVTVAPNSASNSADKPPSSVNATAPVNDEEPEPDGTSKPASATTTSVPFLGESTAQNHVVVPNSDAVPTPPLTSASFNVPAPVSTPNPSTPLSAPTVPSPRDAGSDNVASQNAESVPPVSTPRKRARPQDLNEDGSPSAMKPWMAEIWTTLLEASSDSEWSEMMKLWGELELALGLPEGGRVSTMI